MAVKLVDRYLSGFVAPHELAALGPQIRAAHETLHTGDGPGNEFLGWLTLPKNYDRTEFARIQAAARKIQADSELLIVIGIGGSYLGARAAIEFLNTPLYNDRCRDTPRVYFAGNTVSATALHNLLRLCDGRDISVNVISKSGTTTEPAIAFRFFKSYLEERYGKEGARSRIYATTDAARGTLKQLADREGYETFAVPDDIGGRYSVLTAVGLLPMAVAGIDIAAVMQGAATAMDRLVSPDASENDCYRYAAYRNILCRKGKSVELLVGYEPRLVMLCEWWKQLYGESEGKDGKGIFPASASFSTDLHSLGQFVQDGSRNLFETVIWIGDPGHDLTILHDPSDGDGLNFLQSQPLSLVNRKAFEGTILAHTDGGVPNLVLEVPIADAFEYGYLTYFFEKACAVSGYMLGVNPFDQPGVEAYKRNMFALLGKPGFEAERAVLEARLAGTDGA